MSSFLTWPQARDLALAGTPVRRDAWLAADPPSWLEHRTGLWVLTDLRHALVRVVDAGWFALAEFYANDWTTDPPGTPRDICQIDPPKPVFVPPGIMLTGVPGMTSIGLHADVGASVPAGVFTIEYFLDGVHVGSVEAAGPGRYTLTAPFSFAAFTISGRCRAWIDVTSSLPLPAWTGHAEWSMPDDLPEQNSANWFVGFSDPSTFFAEYTRFDYDEYLMSGSNPNPVDEGVGHLVDGHVTWRILGGGFCYVKSSTGNFAGGNSDNYPGFSLHCTAGSVWPVATVKNLITGQIISNTRRNYDSGGYPIWAQLSGPTSR